MRKHREKIHLAIVIAIAFVLSYIYAHAVKDHEKQVDSDTIDCVEVYFGEDVDHPQQMSMDITRLSDDKPNKFAMPGRIYEIVREHAPFDDYEDSDIEVIQISSGACDGNPLSNPVN